MGPAPLDNRSRRVTPRSPSAVLQPRHCNEPDQRDSSARKPGSVWLSHQPHFPAQFAGNLACNDGEVGSSRSPLDKSWRLRRSGNTRRKSRMESNLRPAQVFLNLDTSPLTTPRLPQTAPGLHLLKILLANGALAVSSASRRSQTCLLTCPRAFAFTPWLTRSPRL